MEIEAAAREAIEPQASTNSLEVSMLTLAKLRPCFCCGKKDHKNLF